jgi:gliding motility-associated-like protein
LNPKYRILFALPITLLAFWSQTVFGQSKTFQQAITVPNQASCNCSLAITSAVTNSSLCNENDGAIRITTTGGSGSYVFLWKDQTGKVLATTPNLTNILPGNYYFEVSDANAPQCGAFAYAFTVSSSLDILTTVTDNDNCTTAGGSISVTPTGGSGNYSYRWKFPDGSESTSRNLANIRAGAYQLTLTDLSLGCTTTKAITVKSRSLLTVTVNSQLPNTSCVQANGKVDITVTGGSGQYQYYWYDLTSFGIVAATRNISGVKGGNYSVFVTDMVSGCSGYQYATVGEGTVAPRFSVVSTTANSSCSAPFTGAIDLTINGTPGPYDVVWSDDKGVVASTEDPTGLPGGTYGVWITDTQTKCQAFVSPFDDNAIVIVDETAPTIDVTIDNVTANSACGTSNGAVNITLTDPLVPYTYTWTGPNNFSASTEDITALPPGTYILRIEAACNLPPVIATQSLSLGQPTLRLNLLELITDPNDNLDPASITIVQKPASQAEASIDGTYYLNLDYSNTPFTGLDNLRIRACDLLDACTEEVFQIQITKENGGIIIYNAVAPNSRGDNKYMRIINLPPNNTVSVFNRWGDLVFNTRNYNGDVPGQRFEGVGQDGRNLPTGTYFYKIEFDDGPGTMTGYLALKQ